MEAYCPVEDECEKSQFKGQPPSPARASGSCSTESVAEFLEGVLLSRTIRSINQA